MDDSDRLKKENSDRMKRMWQDPEWREKQLKLINEGKKRFRGTPESAEAKRKQSAKQKENWKNPEYREKNIERQREGARKRWADPEKRAALMEIRRQSLERRKGMGPV